VTDFRRPDLDLWEEEDDAEDGRPTIVSERPTSALAGKATKASDRTIPFGTVPGDRKTPEVQRSGLVQRLIEQGALEDESGLRNSTEELRDSEIDLLTLPADPEDATQIEPTLDLVAKAAPSTASATPRPASRIIDGVESEPATEDQVPTVSVKRPLPPLSGELTAGVLAAKSATAPQPGKQPFSADREVTERISIPSGMVGSIAPATRTFRPAANERKGTPFWQTALAALVLLGGGISIAKFQSEQRNQTSVAVTQPAGVAREEISLPVVVATPPVAAAEEPSAPAAPEQPLNSIESPPPAIGPLPAKRDDSVVPVSRTRRVRERTAIAASEEPASEVAPTPAPAPVKSAAPLAGELLPAHPTREQVASSLDAVTTELRKCVGERHGLAEVTVTVRPAGFVSYAVVSGEYAGTSEGSCIARAVRAAKFPAFSDPTLRVTYPFQL
jgi:hypothetical protein